MLFCKTKKFFFPHLNVDLFKCFHFVYRSNKIIFPLLFYPVDLFHFNDDFFPLRNLNYLLHTMLFPQIFIKEFCVTYKAFPATLGSKR